MPPLITALLILTLSAPAATDPYELGLQRYREADYMGAADAFRLSVAHPSNTERQARANVWLGVCLFDINETEAARLAFKSALLLDRTLTLPDEAPPTAQPLFDDVRRSLPPESTGPAQPLPPRVEPQPAPAQPPPTASAPRPEPDFVRPEQPGDREVLHPWMAGVGLGVTGGLAITAGALELGCHTNFDAAVSSPYAHTADSLIERGQSEQRAAAGVAIAAGVTLVASAAIYFLSH